MEGTYFACRPLQYGPRFPEDMLDLHQVFDLRHEPNDETLVRLKYVASLSPKARTVQCGKCGARFTDEFGLNRHGAIRHTEQRGPKIVDDTLPKIDLNDPAQLEARAAQLRRELKHMIPVDGLTVPNPEAEIEKAAAEEAELLDEMHPIDFTKTAANQKGNDTAPVPEVNTRPVRRGRRGGRRRAQKEA